MLCASERVITLLVIFESVAVPSDDCQLLDHVLVGDGLGVHIQSLDFAVELQQELSKNKGILTLLVLEEQGDSLLGLLDILLPHEYVSWIDTSRPCLSSLVLLLHAISYGNH